MTQSIRETILWYIDQFLLNKNMDPKFREDAKILRDILEYNEITPEHFNDLMFEDYDIGIKILENYGYINLHTFKGQFKNYIKGLK